MESEPPHNYIT